MVVKVTINDEQGAQQVLRSEVVPRVSQAPGFVAGYWLSPEDGKGLSIVAFESEEQARAMAEQIESPPSGEVTIDSVQVREAAAHA